MSILLKIFNIFNILHEFNYNYVNDLKEMSEYYLQRNGFKYFGIGILILYV